MAILRRISRRNGITEFPFTLIQRFIDIQSIRLKNKKIINLYKPNGYYDEESYFSI